MHAPGFSRPASFQRPSSTRTAGAVTLARVVLLVVLLAGGLTACGDDGPKVRAYDVSEAGRSRCPALIAALPEKVAGKERVALDDPYAAAWGDPAIILRCGVGEPEGFDDFSACQRTEGVDWFVPESVMEDQRADVLMSTVGRSPGIDVLVPARYRPTAGPMVDLAEAIKATTEATDPCL